MKHLVLAICALLVLPLVAADSPTRQPNIVMIMVDELGLYDLNCYGYEAVDKPNAN